MPDLRLALTASIVCWKKDSGLSNLAAKHMDTLNYILTSSSDFHDSVQKISTPCLCFCVGGFCLPDVLCDVKSRSEGLKAFTTGDELVMRHLSKGSD